MTQKEYILRLLYSLNQARPMAKALSILVESNSVDDNLIDILINTIENCIVKITDVAQREHLENAKKFLINLKEKESLEKNQDEKDIIELEKMLQEI